MRTGVVRGASKRTFVTCTAEDYVSVTLSLTLGLLVCLSENKTVWQLRLRVVRRLRLSPDLTRVEAPPT